MKEKKFNYQEFFHEDEQGNFKVSKICDQCGIREPTVFHVTHKGLLFSCDECYHGDEDKSENSSLQT